MRIRRLGLTNIGDVLTPEAIDAIIAQENLLRMGALPRGGELISGARTSYLGTASGSSDSASPVFFSFAPVPQKQPSGLFKAYKKVVSQMRDANIGADAPRLEEPVSDAELTYPTDKVINIQRGRKLNRKA